MPTVDYRINNKKVPSVTTVLGRFKNSTGLVIWANQIGLKGQLYHDELKKAGTIGTALHDLAELHIKNEYYELPQDEKVSHCFTQFLQWWDNNEYNVTWTEKNFCSSKYSYGGTPDLLVNENILVDFKTSKGIYSDYLVQGSAYAQLIKENQNIDIDKFIICRFPKDNSETEIKEFSKDDLKYAFKYFKVLRKAFDLDKQISKLTRAKGK